MIDYNGIINNLQKDKVKKLLYDLGVEQVIEKENCFITNTICHNIAGGSLKLYFYFDTKLFVCYSNCEAMSIFKFLEEYYKTRDFEYDWYNDIYRVIVDCSLSSDFEGFKPVKRELFSERYKKRAMPQLQTYNKNVLDTFTKFYPAEWINEGITKETMDKYNILYSIPQNKIIIPHYSVDNELVGIRGRALNDWEIENIGKYAPIKLEGTWYKHPLSLNLYGLNMNKENIKNRGYVYLFEGEKSVLVCDSFSQVNCAAAVCGNKLNKFQLNLLIKECHPKEIIICFDKEEKRGEDKYLIKLYNLCKKYNNYANFSFIYDTDGLLDMKDAPCDKGEEVFYKLLERRIKVK